MDFAAFVRDLFSNRILLSAMTGWFAAQLGKTILYFILNRELRLERMVGAGGMPSSHAATVCALVVSTAYNYSPQSFEFAIAFLLAVVVLHDARGVRLETGKQAQAIKDMYQVLDTIMDVDMPEVEKLKVLVGHTPSQVFVGGVIGILTGIFVH